MKSLGERLLAGLKKWRFHRKNTSVDDEPDADIVTHDAMDQPERGSHAKLSITISTSDSAGENEAPPQSDLKSGSEGLSPNEDPRDLVSVEIPVPSTTAKSSQNRSRPRRQKAKDRPVTDRELAALEAENARLKRLLAERLRLKENRSQA